MKRFLFSLFLLLTVAIGYTSPIDSTASTAVTETEWTQIYQAFGDDVHYVIAEGAKTVEARIEVIIRSIFFFGVALICSLLMLFIFARAAGRTNSDKAELIFTVSAILCSVVSGTTLIGTIASIIDYIRIPIMKASPEYYIIKDLLEYIS